MNDEERMVERSYDGTYMYSRDYSGQSMEGVGQGFNARFENPGDTASEDLQQNGYSGPAQIAVEKIV